MSIFGKKNKQIESLQMLNGDVLSKVMDLCVKFDLLCDKLAKMDDQMAVFEAILTKLGTMLFKIESKIGVEFKPLIKIAERAVEAEERKRVAESAKNAEEFQKTRKDLSDEDKEMLSTRLLLLLKRDAENLNLPAEMDGGISSDFNKMYNELRVKHGLKPVEAPQSAQTEWKKIEDVEPKKTEKEKMTNTKKGKKNGKKPTRNRKAKATGSRNAVSSDKKLAN